jgi:hypothetical protein
MGNAFKHSALFCTIIVLSFLIACGSSSNSTQEQPAGTSDKGITSFSFSASDNPSLGSDTASVITGTNILITVPYGTDITALTADFTITGATVTVNGVTQESGVTRNDYTNPVTFTVTALDGSTQNWSVTVTVAASSDKNILSFSFLSLNNSALPSDVTGVISGTSIALTVPFGTDVTALIPTFTTSGSSVSVADVAQTSGTTSADFTSAVTYTVTAADSTTKDYTVSVITAPSSAKEITSFKFETSYNSSYIASDVVGEISGTSISVQVPYNTDIRSLVATFVTTGASVSVGENAQTSAATANDFTSPVAYTVTAADSTTKIYTVTVTVALSPAKDITSFNLQVSLNPVLSSDVTGVINGTNITLYIPAGIDVTALKPTFTTTGASVLVGGVAQSSGSSSHSFTSPVTYTVTAADATTKDYSVTVSNGNRITYSANGASGSVPLDANKYFEGSTVTVIGNTGGLSGSNSFMGWNTQADGSGTQYYARDIFTMGLADVTLYAQWGTVPSYTLGSVGPAGGWIFYINSNGAVDGWYYLEVSPYGQGSVTWSGDVSAIGCTATDIGSGQANTTMIVNARGTGDYAAKVCADLSISNEETIFSDWFLPSKDELNQIYLNLTAQGIGNVSQLSYWSSSEDAVITSSVYSEYFNNDLAFAGRYAGYIDGSAKNGGMYARAIRKF